ncbi:MAG: T9SS type A sorting domain-containing protein, partial [Bacteroidales bacterium]|nr:T9SS type A sorting domain-containing protein [Bacteroidales bacterium]
NDVEYIDPVSFPAGTEVTLLADFPLPWPFIQWQGDLTGNNNPETLIMDGDKNVIADFVFVEVEESIKSDDVILIYPNPAFNELYLYGDQIETIALFAIDCCEVKFYTDYSSGKSLDISDLTPGVYIVKVNNSDTWVGKFIKE